MTEIYFLNKCKNLIEEKFESGKSETWIKKDFDNLSEEIYKSSKIIVSIDTLRRIFGQKKTPGGIYNPHIATKNALAIYLGYNHWSHFKETLLHEKKKASNISALPTIDFVKKRWKFKKIWFVLLTALVTVIFLFPNYPDKNPKEPNYQIAFNAANTKGFAPHTVSFTYDISSIKHDSVHILFDDYNHQKPVYLPANKHFITNSFIIPNYSRVQLSIHKKVLKQIGIHVLSKGWEFFGYNGIYFNFPIKNSDGILYVSPEQFKAYNVNNYEYYWGVYQNYREFKTNGDNCTLEARIKNNHEIGGISCFDSEIELIGVNDYSKVGFVFPGCNSFAHVHFGDAKLNGDLHNLSAFAKNITEWRTIKIAIKNKNAQVYFDGKIIYRISYNKPIGNIKGLRFRFKGFGAVDFVRLYNSKDNLTFEDNFD